MHNCRATNYERPVFLHENVGGPEKEQFVVVERLTAEALQSGTIKGTLRRRIAYIFLVHLESIYYEIFLYSKIVPNCAVAK